MAVYDLDQFSKPCPEGEGWYVLHGGRNWAPIEGFASEWLDIAEAIRLRCRHQCKRVAVAGAGPGFAVTLWSPRNAASEADHVELTTAETDALAARIVAVLREAGEACAQALPVSGLVP